MTFKKNKTLRVHGGGRLDYTGQTCFFQRFFPSRNIVIKQKKNVFFLELEVRKSSFRNISGHEGIFHDSTNI